MGGKKPSNDATSGRSRRDAPSAQSGAGPARGTAPGADVRLSIKSWPVNLLLHLATAGLLTLAFPPVRWTWTAHVALVPMLVAVVRSPGRRVLGTSSILAGIAFFAGNMYWMHMITAAAYVGVVLYSLIFWVAFAVLVRWMSRRTRLPLVLVAPLFWVSLEWLRSWVLTGFPWLYLGHPQAASPVLLQVADLTGVYGLSALSAATAGFVADLLTRPVFLRYGPRVRVARSLRVSLAVLAAVWVFVPAYGWWRLRPVETVEGPLVVTVQTSVPQRLRPFLPDKPREQAVVDPKADAMEDVGFKQTRSLTDDALAQTPKADLVVWPETIVPGYMNESYLAPEMISFEAAQKDPRFAQEMEDPEGFRKRLRLAHEHQAAARTCWQEIHSRASSSGAAILVGALSLEPEGPRYNSAYLFKPGDAALMAAARYDKVHLVPFGEFVPFRRSAPWLYSLLLAFTPYSDEYNLTQGEELTVMTVARSRFAVPICFEDAFADLCREMVYRQGHKRADFLVNISNDGWFWGTVELDQHWDLSAFRAVENRVPVVRSVNTGISGFIDSCGRTVDRVTDEIGRVRSITGSATHRLALDPRESFYGRHGDVFAIVLSLLAVVAIIFAAVGPRRAAPSSNDGRGGRSRREGAP